MVRARVAALALLAVAACGGIPTGGNVVEDRRLAPGDDGPAGPANEVRPLLAGPTRGAAPVAIVRGFLKAHFDLQSDGHAFARQHLADDARWDDASSVTVTSEMDVTAGRVTAGRATVQVKYTRLAIVSATGEYRASALRPVVTEPYSLTSVNGEWRISGDVPNGLRLRPNDLALAFPRVVLYFPDLANRRLVPDPVFLPRARGAEFATAVARRLLRGPTSALGARAVRTALPLRTALLGGLRLVDGVAEVNLSREAAAVTGAANNALVAQVVYTLTNPNPALVITGVRLLVEGEPLPIAGRDTSGRAQRRVDWPAFDPATPPAADGLYFVRDGAPHVIAAPSAPAGRVASPESGLTRFAPSPDGGAVVATRPVGGRTAVLMGPPGGALAERLRTDEVLATTWGGRSDQVLVLHVENGTPAIAVIPADPGTRVTRFPVQQTVSDIRLAPDGVHIAVVDGLPGARRLLVGWFGPTGIDPDDLRMVSPQVGAVRSVAWSTPTRLSMIAGGAEPQIWQCDVDGFNSGQVAVAGLGEAPRRITARLGRPLVVEAGAGRLYRFASPGWVATGAGREPTYAG